LKLVIFQLQKNIPYTFTIPAITQRKYLGIILGIIGKLKKIAYE